ncbi:hypothetical protein AX15_007422 [Amanita polypyramis BW_CC]|nr:hypothetical protein AX15_007422 [Amanita polypyramis BW_CC]
MLDSLIHLVEGSSFGVVDQQLEWLLENLLAFFFPWVARMVTAMDHVLLFAPDVPKKYGGTGPNPLTVVRVVPPHELEAPPLLPLWWLLLPLLLSPCMRLLTPWLLCSPGPLRPPPSSPPKSFVEVAAVAPPPASTVPKSACLRKVCTKQGMKSHMALLRLSPAGPPLNLSALADFVASRPLGNCIPVSYATTLHGDWSLVFQDPLTLPDLQRLQAAVDAGYVSGTEVANHPTSASIKFTHVPTIHPDGSAVTDTDLSAALSSHPHWQSVSFVTPLKFVHPAGRPSGLSALVFCEVRDSRASSTARSLLKSTVNFFGTFRRTQAWIVAETLVHYMCRPPSFLAALGHSPRGF